MRERTHARFAWVAILIAGCSQSPDAPKAIVARHQPDPSATRASVLGGADAYRTGWYPNQSLLDPAIVTGGSFGQVFDTVLTGQVYAQPLLDNGTVFVATEENYIYALDPITGAIRHARGPLHPSWDASTLPGGCGDLLPHVGITGTPVIDTTTHTAYFTSKTYANTTTLTGGVWWMHAVDVATLAERPGFPVLMQGTSGNGTPPKVFDPRLHLQRPGLILLAGVVYAAFGSHCDVSPFQGWIIGVDAATGAMRTLWTDYPSTTYWGAGIWQSGGGLISDGAGTLLIATGNNSAIPDGTPVPGNTPPELLGQTVVRLNVQPDAGLVAVDFFSPYDSQTLDQWDGDLGSGGPMAFPDAYFGTPAHPHLLAVAGKAGYLYLLDRDNLGGHAMGAGGSDHVVARIGPIGGVWSKPAVWPGNGGWLYVPSASASGTASQGGTNGTFQAFQYGLDGSGNPTLSFVVQTPDTFGFSSSHPIVTSDGTRSGSAVVWIIRTTDGNTGGGGELRAYMATPGVGGWNTPLFRASIGNASKFVPPGVGDGRLYVGTRGDFFDLPDGGYTGHVIGFGVPTATTLTAQAVDVGSVIVGQSGGGTLVFTAAQAVQVTAVSSSNARFTLGTPTPALPVTLATGQTLAVPVTFTPLLAGLTGTTVTATTANSNPGLGTVVGTGLSSSAVLVSAPTVLSFGGTVVGRTATGSVTFRNAGGSPLTITGVQLPGLPYSVTGAPAVNTVLDAGVQIAVGVTFTPTVEGTFQDEITLQSTAGPSTVPITGAAATAGYLIITPGETLDAGTVQVGSSVGVSFTLTNDGGTTITFLKSKPPSGIFSATTALPEGSTLAAKSSVVEMVVFAPTDAGPAQDHWVITADDDTGLHDVVFLGTGARPDAGQPDAGQPDAGQPDAGQPDAGRPDAGQLDAGQPDAGQPDAGQPDAGQPDAGRPDAGQPDAGQPDAGQPDAGQPDAGQPDAGQPDAGQPDAGQPDAGQPDAGRPDAGQPDAGQPDAGQPDAGRPDAGQPDAGQPDAGQPDAGQPDAGQPDAGQPDAGQPDAGQPDAGQLDAGQPDAGQPDAGQPDAGQPDAGQPDAGQPDAGQPDAGQPDAGQPDAGGGGGSKPASGCACSTGSGTNPFGAALPFLAIALRGTLRRRQHHRARGG